MPTPEEAMAYIWSKIPKQRGGQTIRYIKGDLDYLYENGFVDSRKYTMQEWINAFNRFEHDDGSYYLTKEQFVSLHKYRETSPLKVFDARQLEDGPWTDEELQKIYDKHIVPVSDIKRSSFWVYINALKQAGRINPQGLFLFNKEAKQGLQDLIEEYPSPRVRLDWESKRIKNARQNKLIKDQEYRDGSGFSVGENITETTRSSLSSLESISKKPTITATQKAQKPQQPTPATHPTEPEDEFDIKNLRKPGGKVFG